MSVYFTTEEDESSIYSVMNIGQLKGTLYSSRYYIIYVMASSTAGFFGHTFAHINTLVALIEYMSSSTHDIASRRLAAAHKFLSDEDHSTCKDWFECFLRTKSIILCNDEREAPDYFNGVCALHV